MNRGNSKGFSLLIAVACISLAAGTLYVLAATADSLMVDADRDCIEACSRNLSASAAAWARQNADTLAAAGEGGIALDAALLEIPHASLHVAAAGHGAVEVQIECRRGRATCRRTATFAPAEGG